MDYEKWQADLLAIPLSDLGAIHAAWKLGQDELSRAARRGVAAEAVRWSEWALSRSLYEAQVRGEVSSRYNPHGISWEVYTPPNMQIGKLAAQIGLYTREQFAQALADAKRAGSLAAVDVMEQLRKQSPDSPSLNKAGVVQIKPTKRGERLLRNLALTLNSLAAGCADVNVDEVDGAALQDVLEQARADVGLVRGFLMRVKD